MKVNFIFRVFLALALTASLAAGCGQNQTPPANSSSPGGAPTSSAPAQPNFDLSQEIVVISREDGSGTRGAFVELTGVQDKDKIDHTTKEAEFVSQTSVVLTSVQDNEAAIGYISLGSLNNLVKAVKFEGVEATAENVKNGSYTLARPFNIAYKGEATGLKKDFIDFIFSKQGQTIAEEKGTIAIKDGAAEYKPSGLTGKLTIAGSSSVTPVMEKLVEGYMALNPGATLELQQSDSSAGMTAAVDGTADIGMASRELKDSEKAELNHAPIAMDGIAVIVNLNNSVDNLTKAQVAGIYTGGLLTWSDVA